MDNDDNDIESKRSENRLIEEASLRDKMEIYVKQTVEGTYNTYTWSYM